MCSRIKKITVVVVDRRNSMHAFTQAINIYCSGPFDPEYLSDSSRITGNFQHFRTLQSQKDEIFKVYSLRGVRTVRWPGGFPYFSPCTVSLAAIE